MTWPLERPSERSMERVILIGNTASGKSTLGAELARRLDASFVDLDALFWLPGWQEPDPEAFRAKVREATRGDRWVSAGNYLRHLDDITWPRAQTVIHLDLGLRTSLWRVLRRSWRRSRSGELLWGTNTESFAKHLKLWSREDSLLAWAVYAHVTRRPRLLARRSDPRWAQLDFVRLRTPGEVERWLASAVPRRR